MNLNFSMSSLMAGFIFGVFGFTFLRLGKREAHIPKLLIGLSLMIYPYFITNDYLLWIIGVVLIIIGYKLR